MNQVERIIEIKLAQRTIEWLDRQLFYLNKDMSRLVKTLMDKNAEPEALAAAQIAIDTLAPRIAALENRRFQMRQYIEEIDGEAARDATIRVVSETGDRAQIVITYLRDDGKKMSSTRHVRREGSAWVGFSTLTTNKVRYRIPDTSSEEAA